jgi:hypothetical protein
VRDKEPKMKITWNGILANFENISYPIMTVLKRYEKNVKKQ